MSAKISSCESLLRSRLQIQRFDLETLRILESTLVARDVGSLLETRSALRDLLKSEAKLVLKEIVEKSVEEKLGVVDFFVQAFSLIGDVESCLALKYEALVLRDTQHYVDHLMWVSFDEWLTFAKDSLDNGFYAVAVKGFDNALLCVQQEGTVVPESGKLFVDDHIINNVLNLRDMAMTSITSLSGRTKLQFLLKVEKEYCKPDVQEVYKQKEHAKALRKSRTSSG